MGVDVQLFQHSLKEYPFSTELPLHLCQELIVPICEGPFICPFVNTTSFDYYNYIASLKIGWCYSSKFYFFIIALTITVPLLSM